ncbi:MAG: nucleoside 2-deoxyribosyltransferase [Candidatus Taylorbacteria bacterium]
MKSVVICGSNRFAKEAMEFAKKLEALGVEVLTPHFYTANYGDLNKVPEHHKKFIAMGLTHDQFQKIRVADAVFVFNKDGYSGYSVSMEIGFATALAKPIYAFSENDPEICRNILFQAIVKTPKQLANKLK